MKGHDNSGRGGVFIKDEKCPVHELPLHGPSKGPTLLLG